MQWDAAWALWALLAVVALGAAMLRLLARRRAALESFAEAGLVDRLVAGLDRRRRTLRLWLRLVALALLVVAIAGPRLGFRWQEVRREGIDLVVALDTSRSMLAPDVAPNRLERAKLAVLDLLEKLKGDRIALVAFAGTAFLECPLTLDYGAFELSLKALHAGIIPRGGTALGRAIDTALQSFDARQGKFEALVLITDGEDHEGDVEEAARRAAAAGVKIYTVGIGTAEGELLPGAEAAQGFFKDRQGRVVKSHLDEQTLQKIAELTGGAYVRGLGPSLGLGEVFDEHIASMERRDVGTRLERRWEPRFQFPLAVALLLLVIEAGLGDARRAPGRLGAWLRRARSGAASAALVAAFASLLAVPRARAGEPAASHTIAGEPAIDGYRLYGEKKYADAALRWREALVDEPDSRLLHYNLGAALYRDGKFEEAAQQFAAVVADGDPEWKARAAYNQGNALYRQGAALEGTEPQKAIEAWQQALAAYLSAMAADPADTDPKFGYELVAKKLRELQDKLEKEKQKKEEEQQQQEQQQQQQANQDQQNQQGQEQQPKEQKDEQQQQDGQEQQQQAEQQQNADSQPQDQQQEQQQQQAESGEEQQQQAEQQQQQAGGEQQGEQDKAEQQRAAEQQAAAEAGEEQPPEEQGGEPSAENAQPAGKNGANAEGGTPLVGKTDEQNDLDHGAARAVLDTARREELAPGEVEKRAAGAGVAEPLEDW
jgi:Ca-activated chloride channel family protein